MAASTWQSRFRTGPPRATRTGQRTPTRARTEFLMLDVMSVGGAKITSPPRNPLHTLAAVAVLCGTLAAGSAARAAGAPAAQDLSGVWWATAYSPKIQIVGGGDLPYTAAGKAAYDKNIAALKSGELIDVARRFCGADGLPRFRATPYPFGIVHTYRPTTMI